MIKWKMTQWVKVICLVVCLTLVDLPLSSWAAGGELFDAARSGDLKRVKLLIAANADANAVNKDGVTALIAASVGGYTEVVKALIAANADVNAKDKDTDITALIAASAGGYTEVVTERVNENETLPANI